MRLKFGKLHHKGPPWSDFLRSHAQSMLATKYFHIDAVNEQRHYPLFVNKIERRVVRVYAFNWGERVLILGGDGRCGHVTPPAYSSTRSR